MPDKARIVTTDQGQAVRLPDGYRFEGQDEVLIYRQGQRIILEPERHGWSRRFLALAGSAPDFPDPHEPLPAEAGPAAPQPLAGGRIEGNHSSRTRVRPGSPG